MQPDTAQQQVVALLQDVGLLTAEAGEDILRSDHHVGGNVLQALLNAGTLSFDTLQEALLRYGRPAAESLPAAAPQTSRKDLNDEFAIDDQQLRELLRAQNRLAQEQLDAALQDQQQTGHPLWRTLINLGFLTTQEMTTCIAQLGVPGVGRIEVGQALVPQARSREAEWHSLEIGATASPVQVVEAILEGAAQARATDIHIEPQKPRMRIRYRIDGMLFDVMTIPPALEMSIISRVKILADMNITERRLPQDGRLSVRIAEQDYNLRVATIPTVDGEKLVMRLLSKDNILTGLKQLGLESEGEQRLRSLIANPQGMILVTGPIGSGKTTTLYACLNEVNILSSNIVTIEEPVEYQLPGINQVEVDLKAGLTFANGLRSILRQDADILMVGEIRDVETATVAIRAALTGQQLFSTLHTVDTPSAITTLGNFGIPPYLIASALSGVVAQRLVRKVCSECQQWYTPSHATLAQLGMSVDAHGVRFAYGKGCDACYHTGYMGRTGIFEILLVSENLKQLIIEQASEHKLQTAAVQEGMSTLAQSGLKKIAQGMTTPQEVMREVHL